MAAQIGRQIESQLAMDLKRGRFGGPGETFCTVRELAERCSVSLVTAHKIVRRLTEEHLLRRSGRNMVLTEFCRNARIPRKIGVLVTNLDNPFFSRLLNAIELSGRRHGIEAICRTIRSKREEVALMTNSMNSTIWFRCVCFEKIGKRSCSRGKYPLLQ